MCQLSDKPTLTIPTLIVLVHLPNVGTRTPRWYVDKDKALDIWQVNLFIFRLQCYHIVDILGFGGDLT